MSLNSNDMFGHDGVVESRPASEIEKTEKAFEDASLVAVSVRTDGPLDVVAGPQNELPEIVTAVSVDPQEQTPIDSGEVLTIFTWT